MSVVVFAGEPVITPRDIRVTIDCGKLIDKVVNTTGITNPKVTWFKNGRVLLPKRTALNVILSADQRFCIITESYAFSYAYAGASQKVTSGNYSCEVCSTPTNCLRNDTCVAVCGELDT